MKKTFILILLVVSLSFSREYSLSFLKLPTTARYSALAAYIAISDDIAGIFCNPSGLVNSNYQIGFSHNEHFQQIKYDMLGFILPRRKYVLSVGVTMLSSTGIEGRKGDKDLDPAYINIYQVTEPEFDYDILDIQAGVGIAKMVSSKLSSGLTLKYVSEKIYDVEGKTFLFDTGLMYELSKSLRLGFVLNNFGLPIKYVERYYPAYAQIGLGCGYSIERIRLVVDIIKPVYDDLFVTFGSELKILEFLFLRLGYKYKPEGWQVDDIISGGSLGVGVNYFGIKVDYSITSFGMLGLSHKISVIVEIDKMGKYYKLLREWLFRR
ncbi:MAG: PorV/PorQ family protein [Endomicrobia bacterium]|nr:PorV/PorQ family protein [Endomicrobiia bacterium]MDW8055101.1 PorV/PorQ family protein [Elusimicrobiota bacterium]